MRARNARTIHILAVVIALFAAFLVGFAIRGNAPLLDSMGFPQSMTGIAPEDAEANAAPKEKTKRGVTK